jgi:probable HAF family extracellular repeat protein
MSPFRNFGFQNLSLWFLLAAMAVISARAVEISRSDNINWAQVRMASGTSIPPSRAGYYVFQGVGSFGSGQINFDFPDHSKPSLPLASLDGSFNFAVNLTPPETVTTFAFGYGPEGNINGGFAIEFTAYGSTTPPIRGDVRVLWNGTTIATKTDVALATRASFGVPSAGNPATDFGTLVVSYQNGTLIARLTTPLSTNNLDLYQGAVPGWNPQSSWRYYMFGRASYTGSDALPIIVVQADSVELQGKTAPFVATPPANRTSWQDFPDTFNITVDSLDGVALGNVVVTVQSSNQALFADSQQSVTNISPAGRQITLHPVRGATGSANITLRLDPGGGLPVGTYTFQQTVTPNIPPTISPIADQSLPQGYTRTLPFTASSPRWPASQLTFEVSAPESLLANYSAFVPFSSGTGHKLTLTAGPEASGTGKVVVKVTDGSGDSATSSFNLTALPRFQPPSVLGSGTALALNDAGGPRQYAIDTNAFDVGTGSTMTIESWVYATALPDSNLNVVATVGTPGETHGLILAVQKDGSPSVANWFNDLYPTNATLKISTNRWHHLAVAVNGQAVTLYVDGQVSVNGLLREAINIQSGQVIVGREPLEDAGLDRPWFGYLDNVRVWSTVRSAAEIQGNMLKTVAPDAPGLLRDFRCDESFVHFDGGNTNLVPSGLSLGGVLRDSSAKQKHLGLVESPVYVPGVSFGATVNVPEDNPATFGLGAAVVGTNVWGTAGVAREIYFGPITSSLADGLVKSPGWPAQPDVVLASGIGLELSPDGRAGYGERWRGYLLAPETGTYTFAIASANEGQLWLSTDEAAGNLRQVASSPATGVSFRRFDFNPAQQTATVALNAGRRYYFEVRHQADNGANGSAHLSVRWTLPSGLVETPIPAYRVQPLGPPPANAPTLSYAVEVPPDGGTLTIANGSATYQPTPNFFGTDSFVYRAISGTYASAPVLVNLNVVNRDDAPVAGSGHALHLGGKPSGVATTESFDLNGGSFTLELWARRADTNGPAANDGQTLVHLGPEVLNSTPGAVLGWVPGGQVVFETRLGSQAATVPSSTATLDTNWHHWAAVFDAATGRRELFRDAISQGSVISTNPGPDSVQMFIGSVYGFAGWFRGDVDEVRLWNVARSIEQITGATNIVQVGDEDGLVAYYRFDEGNGLTAQDSSMPKPGGVRLNAAITDPVTWISGVTTFDLVEVPRNSPGQFIFLPGSDLDGDALTYQINSATPANGRLQPDPARPGVYTYIPNLNFKGNDLLRYQVTAGGRTSEVATITLYVADTPLPPVIAQLRDVEFEEEDPPVLLPLVVSDVDDSAGARLKLTATSSNPALLPLDGIQFGGSGNERTVTLDPAAGEVGTSTVEITVSNDGSLTASTKFQVRVSPRLAYVVVNAGDASGRAASVATALNQTGQLAGWAAGTATITNSQPFFYTGYGDNAQGFLVENLGGTTGGALAVNESGLIVGAVTDAQGASRAFVVDPQVDTQPTDLGWLPGGNSSVATAVNTAGLIAGYAETGGGTNLAFTAGPGSTPMTALALTNGYTSMWATAINEAGEIVGYARTASGNTNAFLYALGQVQDLGRPPGADHFIARAVNQSGQVFGHAIFSADGSTRPVRWDHNGWTNWNDTLGGGRTEVSGANRYGQFVGRALDTNGVWRAFLHTAGRAYDLNTLLPSGSGWILDAAAAINNRGQIAVTGRLTNGPPQALVLFPATEIGRRVFRPEGTLALIPSITSIPGGDDASSAFFWSQVDKKLFAISPVVAEIKWRTGTYVVTTNLTEFGTNFIRQRVTNEVTVSTLAFNVWPTDPDIHVVGTPVQVQPNQPGFVHGFLEVSYTEADEAKVDPATKLFTSPSTGHSVLHYLRTGGRAINGQLQPHEFRVTRSVLWNDPAHVTTNVAWTIGSPITNALHGDYPGLNGFVLLTNAPYDPTAHLRAQRSGPILPVNTHTEGGNLVVVWYRQNRLGVAWSDLPYQYALAWPTDAETLVIANPAGSGPLSPSLYSQPRIYQQPVRQQPGFNPNEEHAFLNSGILYALRNDLNARSNPKASDPYVLIRYLDPDSQEPRLKVYAVVAEQPPYFFRYDGVAGSAIQPPPAIASLPLQASNRADGPVFRDYRNQFYAKAAGLDGGEADVVMQFFYPLQPDFFFDFDGKPGPDAPLGSPIPWLDGLPNGITGQPVNVTYVIEWPAQVPTLRLGQTVTTGSGGLPDVSDMAAARVVFDSFNPAETNVLNSAARLFDPLSPRTVDLPDGFEFPDAVTRSVDPSTGLEQFPDLPYMLRVRLFHDPANHRLGFRGFVNTPADGGAAITLVNVMSARERQTITDLAGASAGAWADLIKALYQRTRNPNDVDPGGTQGADSPLLIGLTTQIVTNGTLVTTNVVRENLLGPRALSAGQPLPPLQPQVVNAVHFDGTNGAMSVGPVFGNIRDNFTIELWARPEGGIPPFGERIDANDAHTGQRFAVFPMHGGRAYGGDAIGCGVSVATNGVVVAVQANYLFAPHLVYYTNLVGWHHVAVVYQERQPLLYLDGTLVHVGLTSPGEIHPSADVSLSSYSDYGPAAGPYVGSLTDLRVWNYPRTAAEIASNFDQRLTGAEAGLAGLWRFEENGGTTVEDATSANHHGTLVDGFAWTSDAPIRSPAPRYVVLAENDDPSLGGLPVGLHVIRVDDTPDRGALALIQPDNVLDERVTLRHTADFSGQPESFVFQWFYQFDAAGFRSTDVPGVGSDGSITNQGAWVEFFPAGVDGRGANDLTLGGTGESGLLTLSDTWWVMRYGMTTADGRILWSGWAGDPSGTDAAPRAMLVPGWIKRVLGGINLFAQRSSDFQDNQVNVLANAVAAAGPRYERDVALNPSALDNFGLIETYGTVLRRGRSLSIDGTPVVDFQPADDALLLAAGNLSQLYLLHANEAFADASDPTIGLTTDSTSLGSAASAVFAFQNQVDSLLEEELIMLRGRDDRNAGVNAAPIYNRLFWNFTGGDGEAAYVAKYGIPDQNTDGFITALDAKLLFPQGHGDAWGHYLTALTTYYDLLRHPEFTWVPRAQSTLVAGVPIEVNYQDERRFAQIAAAKARTGAEVVDRTYRLDYSSDPVAQFRGDADPDPQRAWGPTEWARRATLGAYFDWVVGNAILLPIDPDPTHTGIERVDRTTVLDLAQVVTETDSLLALLDLSDAGLNPQGLARGVVPFDIDPDQLSTGFSRVTHFEQVYERALQALRNAETTFNRATLLTSELRKQQNSVSDYSVAVSDQERAFKNDLIGIFGYPHAGNLGAGKAYPADYDGPDLTFWKYVDTLDVTPANNPRESEFTDLSTTFTKLTTDWGTVFSDRTTDLLNPATNHLIEVEYPISTAEYALQAPPDWGRRRAEGRLQANVRSLVLAQAGLREAIRTYSDLLAELEEQAAVLDLRYGLQKTNINIRNTRLATISSFNSLILAAKTTKVIAGGLKSDVDEFVANVFEGTPGVEGLSFDGFAALRALVGISGQFFASIPEEVAEGAEIAEAAFEFSNQETELALEVQADNAEENFELTERVKELEVLVRQEPALRLNLFNARQAILQAARDLESTQAEGQRLLVNRTVFRQATAGNVQALRYRDLGLRIFRNDALQKYDAQFELTARYVQLAAAAYDYELNLGDNAGAGTQFSDQIVRERNLGELVNDDPVVGRVGLASILGRLRQNFDVQKGQLGLSNPRNEQARFSLRAEAFRILPAGTNTDANVSWRTLLQQAVVTNLWDVPEFRRYCRPFASESAGPQPGLVLRFGTTITAGQNFFGQPLGPLDSSYDPSEFSTRIRSLAVWLTDYDTAGLAARPRVYLVPVGADQLRAPDDSLDVRSWQVVEQRIPVPFPLAANALSSATWNPQVDSLDGSFTDLRRHSAFRAYLDGTFDLNQFDESSRLVGRSVWNTQWVLIIPGAYLLGGDDTNKGLDLFIQSVSDIKLYFQTYSASGN